MTVCSPMTLGIPNRMQWQCHAVTDAGKKRKLNEDSIYHNEEQQVWAVADGMGGHHRGDLASQTIVRHLQSYTGSHHAGVTVQRLIRILQTSNAELVEKARSENAGVIASTCAVLTRCKHSIICSWVGDSRVYRYRGNVLTQLTRDHSYESLIEDLRNSGKLVDEIMGDTQALTRGVGAEPDLQVEHCHFKPLQGDRYLLCTDGLYKEVPNDALEKYYSQNPSDEVLLGKLHQAYLDGGARDNLGLILVSTIQ